MFYELQPADQREKYKRMLALVGSLSKLFSGSDTPLLYYRAHENIFCRCFDAENLGREDVSADAKKGIAGIGLKTWVGRDDQKIAEFGRLRPEYENLAGLELIKTIAGYRNERIRITKNLHGITELVYHIVKRIPGAMQIYEAAFVPVALGSIVLDASRGNSNNIYFSDGRHTYHFSMSKNTLYMLFDDMVLLDHFNVTILDNPFEALEAMQQPARRQLCLRLYAVRVNGYKYVPERSGLNQWNAKGRKRHADELYIAYLSDDRERDEDFFPPRDTPFTLVLPDGTRMSAKVCQRAYPVDDNEHAHIGKAIMSNPNKILGHWLLRDVFGLPPGTLVTYKMLEIFGVDSVLFTRVSDGLYNVNFCTLGTYERMYNR